MTSATTRPGHVCKSLPDYEFAGRQSCYQCGKVADEGQWSNPLRRSPSVHGRVHHMLVPVPEPIAELDDDGFATARGVAR